MTPPIHRRLADLEARLAAARTRTRSPVAHLSSEEKRRRVVEFTLIAHARHSGAAPPTPAEVSEALHGGLFKRIAEWWRANGDINLSTRKRANQ